MVVKKVLLSHNTLTLIAVALGVASGMFNDAALNGAADVISDTTISLMKLIAVPLLFLSIVSSSAHFTDFEQIKTLGLRIFKYTILTTLIAALVAEALYLIFSPSLLRGSVGKTAQLPETAYGFFDTLLNMVPDNLAGVFLENNVMAAVVIAVALAIAILGIKPREREVVFSFFVGMLNAIMRIVHVGLRFLPLAVWAFVSILTRQVMNNETESLNAIGGLTITVIAANLIQGLVVLPALLRFKGIGPIDLFIKVKEALLVAFFTRSSMATLPVTLDHAIKDAKISEDVARLSFPLCTTINMNGCAQFILLSVYFVSAFTGNALSAWEHVGMIFLSVTAAIGNAGVPMGCFFLASSILASKDVPLYLMGSILPLYTIIDMVETSLNVWSDVSITKIVDLESK
ncbi:MAG TPA: dicarboxylate/amino acid:cation symporter [Myxococcota bacterium]|nr:dicarboxylate/amino acid:cation symporter [Myxococcota bacterium]